VFSRAVISHGVVRSVEDVRRRAPHERRRRRGRRGRHRSRRRRRRRVGCGRGRERGESSNDSTVLGGPTLGDGTGVVQQWVELPRIPVVGPTVGHPPNLDDRESETGEGILSPAGADLICGPVGGPVDEVRLHVRIEIREAVQEDGDGRASDGSAKGGGFKKGVAPMVRQHLGSSVGGCLGDPRPGELQFSLNGLCRGSGSGGSARHTPLRCAIRDGGGNVAA
jgi:hypothetical protein